MSTIYCDFCKLGNKLHNYNYYLKNCKEHCVICNVCYKIITSEKVKEKGSGKEKIKVKEKVQCPCCKNLIKEFLKLPCEMHEVSKDFPFTI